MTREERWWALRRMRADCVPDGTAGLWQVGPFTLTKPGMSSCGKVIPPGTYRSLTRLGPDGESGEAVMSDDSVELMRHLEAVNAATGRVLVMGLGLGCVVRGILDRPGVTSVDIVERDPAIIKLAGESVTHDPRVKIWHTDAAAFIRDTDTWWDVAWIDLWCEGGHTVLTALHAQLMKRLDGRVRWQGAWGVDRVIRRMIERRIPSAWRWAPLRDAGPDALPTQRAFPEAG